MIVTVTPNPSFDRTLHLDEFAVGHIHRARDVSMEGSGKGINVARALALSGAPSTCVFPASADDARRMAALSEPLDEFTWHHVDTETEVRTNITVVDSSGRTTKINEPGDTFDAVKQQRLVDAVAELVNNIDWLVCCGSLPPGMDRGIYGLLAGVAHNAGVKAAIDASGPALSSAVAANVSLIKPNRDELAGLVGRELSTLGDVVDAAGEVVAGGVESVVVSLGSSGAVLVDSGTVVHGVAPTDSVRNTVGAGDGFLAGFLAGGGAGPQALSSALAFGRAAVQSSTTAFPPATDEDRAAVRLTEEIDRGLRVEHE